MFGIYFSLCFLALIVPIILYAIIAGERFQHRLIKYECKLLDPRAILMKDMLPIEEISSFDEYTNLKNDQLIGYLHTVFILEGAKFFTFKRTLFFIEHVIDVAFIAAWIPFYSGILVLSSVSNFVWMGQIKGDIKNCIKLAEEHENLNWRFGENIERKVKLNEIILIVYIHFELFRRRNNAIQSLLSFLVIQFVFLGTVVALLGYFVATNIEIQNINMILVITIFFFGWANICLLLSAYKLKLMNKISKDLLSLLAHCSAASEGLSYPTLLWRRQILEESDTKRFFAIDLIGVNISYETVLTFNIYLIAICFLLVKKRYG